MAITLDVLNAGETGIDSAASTVAVTTTSAIAAGATIILTGTDVLLDATSVADNGPGLTWTVDKTGVGANNACAWICSAYAAAGMASGTVITVTLSGPAAGRSVAVTSFLGILSASPVDTTSGPTGFTATTAWTTASTTIAAGSLLIAVSADFTDLQTSTVTSPSLEAHDIGVGPNQFAATTCYRIESGAGSYTVAGTWSAAGSGTVCAVAYKADAGGAPPDLPAELPLIYLRRNR